MLDYSSGSFTDFILGDQADLAGPGPPIPEPVGPGPAESAEAAGPRVARASGAWPGGTGLLRVRAQHAGV